MWQLKRPSSKTRPPTTFGEHDRFAQRELVRWMRLAARSSRKCNARRKRKPWRWPPNVGFARNDAEHALVSENVRERVVVSLVFWFWWNWGLKDSDPSRMEVYFVGRIINGRCSSQPCLITGGYIPIIIPIIIPLLCIPIPSHYFASHLLYHW